MKKEGSTSGAESAIDRSSILIRGFLTEISKIKTEDKPFGDVQQELERAVEGILKTHGEVGVMKIEGELGNWLKSNKNSIDPILGLKACYVLSAFFAERFSYKVRPYRPGESESEGVIL